MMKMTEAITLASREMAVLKCVNSWLSEKTIEPPEVKKCVITLDASEETMTKIQVQCPSCPNLICLGIQDGKFALNTNFARHFNRMHKKIQVVQSVAPIFSLPANKSSGKMQKQIVYI